MSPAAGPSSKPNFGGNDNDEMQTQIMQGVKEFYRQKEIEQLNQVISNVPYKNN